MKSAGMNLADRFCALLTKAAEENNQSSTRQKSK
uniref:Uncharacterized protein n=1 Tax=Siphoviridae sp. ctrCN24 TaxID=2827953 RepID=A0A8S5SKJ5_9CAUD|nr:MAG TPA: hypothetical protein [Siphoviridae sp. ctrCN24]